ncbi:MASE1 domain-containing protein [Kovacikia minuta CCNUW1]|uniref:adenylate/guanylate cyclase domain-containing protein n=1 Tax=Kovacikia minuta TaxID=2931930 RepID=UPI001CCFB0DD|nr:adenylate/guanylate cyclase domain-containing protein [Kovacikia minuta]UBF27668.1 MASE1 domain-containing protein [Kovacikia minuta CCNUW1]
MALPPTRFWRYGAAIAVCALVYFGVTKLILQIPLKDIGIGWPLWLPAGLAQSVLILYGQRMLPGIALGALFIPLLSGYGFWFSAVSAVNDALQAWFGVALLRRYRFNPRLEQLPDVIKLFVLSAIIPAGFSASVGVLKLCLLGKLCQQGFSWVQWSSIWFKWWIGNVTGVLTLVPVLLTIGQWRTIAHSPRKLMEASLWLGSLLITSWFVFYSPLRLQIAPYPLEYVPFPFIIWGALRFGQAGAALAIALVTNLATWGVVQGVSPFLRGSGDTVQAVGSLQAYICILALTALILAAIMAELQEAKKRSENLLLKILPSPIAERLKIEHQTIADSFPEVTVLFADIVDFTPLSASLSPQELVALLNEIFSTFDYLAEKHGLEKIKTIGDAYMVVGGIPEHKDDHAQAVAEMALDIRTAIANFSSHHRQTFEIRIGINTGPVVAGVIGTKKFLYDLWGDTVNIASRMESQGVKGQIQVTGTTYAALAQDYEFEERGKIQVRGRGEMMTYFLKSRKTYSYENLSYSKVS